MAPQDLALQPLLLAFQPCQEPEPLVVLAPREIRQPRLPARFPVEAIVLEVRGAGCLPDLARRAGDEVSDRVGIGTVDVGRIGPEEL